jgi:hypothetical protein
MVAQPRHWRVRATAGACPLDSGFSPCEPCRPPGHTAVRVWGLAVWCVASLQGNLLLFSLPTGVLPEPCPALPWLPGLLLSWPWQVSASQEYVVDMLRDIVGWHNALRQQQQQQQQQRRQRQQCQQAKPGAPAGASGTGSAAGGDTGAQSSSLHLASWHERQALPSRPGGDYLCSVQLEAFVGTGPYLYVDALLELDSGRQVRGVGGRAGGRAECLELVG